MFHVNQDGQSNDENISAPSFPRGVTSTKITEITSSEYKHWKYL